MNDQRTTIGRYQLFPALSPSEFAELESDILNRGVMVSVEIDEDGEILDGHHRVEICTKHGLEYPTVTRTFSDEIDKRLHVYELNLDRRHMTTTQKACVAVGYEAELAKKSKRGRPKKGATNGTFSGTGKARDAAAKRAGVGRTYISDAKRIKESDPETFAKMVENKVTMKDALREERREAKAADRTERAKAAAKDTVGDDYGVVVGDFREHAEIIADNSVDLIFTDPPYDLETVPTYSDLGAFAARTLKPGGSLITYLGQYALPEVIARLSEHLKFLWPLACVHTGRSSRMNYWGIVVKWKPMLWFVKGKNRRDTQTFVDDLVESQKEKDTHEWQQGITEAAYYIENLTELNDLVVDPFCGGGTTAVAAARLQRQWKTFEINEDSAAIARQRIKDDCEDGQIS